MQKKIMPTIYLLIAMLLCILFHFLIPIVYILPVPWNLLGIIPLILGIWINISADRAFKLTETTVKPFEESSILIQEGVFRWTRNPMYLGGVIILGGLSVTLNNWLCFFPAILFFLFMHFMFIPFEEDKMVKTFGEGYLNYKKKVRRWF